VNPDVLDSVFCLFLIASIILVCNSRLLMVVDSREEIPTYELHDDNSINPDIKYTHQRARYRRHIHKIN